VNCTKSRLRAHQLLELGVPPAFGRGDADVSDAALGLHAQQHRQMRLPGQQVVHLQQRKARHAPELL
jgi:hypothetical protein